jgi:tRNA pseudouridine55 synthase
MSRAPDPFPWRPVHGILLLDKPSGISSNQALQLARRRYAAEKGGHTGSLDPLATGMLPLCFGEATKIAGLLLGERKVYETTARLGIETDSCDADGAIVATRDVPALTPATVSAALQPLTGRILQVPPLYSALKRDGEPLYRKARRGEVVEVEAREVQVNSIELLAIEGVCLRLRIDCGSGTYVRSLVRDLGAALGCGAHVAALRRCWVEPFRDLPMLTLDRLDALAQADGPGLGSALLPLEAGLTALPRIDLTSRDAERLRQGQVLDWTDPSGPAPIALFGPEGRALGLGETVAGKLYPRRLFRPV